MAAPAIRVATSSCAHALVAGGLRLRSPVLRPTGGLAEPLRLENPTTIVPGDRVTHLVYDVCTG